MGLGGVQSIVGCANEGRVHIPALALLGTVSSVHCNNTDCVGEPTEAVTSDQHHILGAVSNGKTNHPCY